MTLKECEAPEVLWRVGWHTGPLEFPPWEYVGGERFDDLRGLFRVLYAADDRLTCFLEVLAHFRPDLAWLAEVHETPPDSEDGDYLNEVEAIPDYLDEVGVVPPDWHLKRRVGWLTLLDGCRGVDLGVLETLNTLRQELASYLHARGYTDFDLSDLLNRDRELSQYTSRHIYDQDYGALVYPSRLGAPSIGVPAKCWGIYERDPDGERPYTPLDTEAISRDDPDLVQAAAIFELTL